MKSYVLKTIWLPFVLLFFANLAKAQFDDVYYDPDTYVPEKTYTYHDTAPSASGEEGVQYYDDDEYGYYEDDGYYYTNRIQRFYHPYVGFGFYAPAYTGFYYDPWDYYYPSSGFSISIGFGIGFGWGSWYGYPYYPYYGYPYYGYGYSPYYGCGAYYPPYYGCGGGYYGCGGGYYNDHWGHHDDHHGGYHDYYYGPRTAGNTGTSPRTPPQQPGIVRPDVKHQDSDVAVDNDRPTGLPEPGTPGRSVAPGAPVTTSPEHTPAGAPVTRGDAEKGVVRAIPEDRELPREQTNPKPQRPVFRPDAQKYQPYPTPQRSTPSGTTPPVSGERSNPTQDKLSGASNGYQPYPHSEKPAQTGTRGTQGGANTPSGNTSDRPRYSPPPRQQEQSGTSNRSDHPTYTPSERSHESANDRPSYSPPSRMENSRSNDRPSYSPSHSSPSPGNSGGGYRSSGGGSSSGGHSSGGSSGGGRSGGSSSPRGKG